MAGALFIFVQELAHLLDCHRSAMLAERFLAFPLIQEWPLPFELGGRDLLLTVGHVAQDEIPVPSSTTNVLARCARTCIVELNSPSRKW